MFLYGLFLLFIFIMSNASAYNEHYYYTKKLLKSYLYLFNSYIKLVLLFCFSNFLISFISSLIPLLSKKFLYSISLFVVVLPVLKLLKIQLVFLLDLQLFSFVFSKVFPKGEKYFPCSVSLLWSGGSIYAPIRYSYFPTLPEDNADTFAVSLLISYCSF